jgi:hypothetical protein
VDLFQESVGEREAALDAAKPVVERTDVVERLSDLKPGHTGSFLVFEQKQLRERGLCPFDLRRENRLLADVRVEELVGIRQQERDAIEPTERLVGAVSEILERFKLEWRVGWKWFRVKDRIGLVAGRNLPEAPGPLTRAEVGCGCARSH